MDPNQTLITAMVALAGLAVIAAAALKGWQGWLELKTRELDMIPHAPREIEGGAGALTAGSLSGRIEIASLRERIRRLEEIAAGVDL